MKTSALLATLAIGMAASAMAADFKGFVIDSKCSTIPAMKADAECAQKCIKGGDSAVLLTPDGKVYKIAEQAKITPFAGKTVTVSGKLTGDTISVASVK